jgi:polyribonucleotide nucleotidyltransferase
MAETMPAPRQTLSPLAPRVGTVKIPVDKIGMLIGPGGKNIRGLQEQYECTIDVEEDGAVYVTGANPDGFEKIFEYLRTMAREPEVGLVYKARVVSTKDFGAFLEFLPGTEGLLHISEIQHGRTDRVEDVLKVGDEIEVKLVATERDGKFRLSRKVLLPRPEGHEETEGQRGGQRDRDGGPRDRDGGSRGRDSGPRDRDSRHGGGRRGR